MADSATDVHAADAAAHGADAAHGAADAAHGDVFPPLDASLYPSQLIWFAITFIALYWFVSTFIVPNVSSILTKRAAAKQADLDAAAQKSADAETARVTMERATAKARADARAMVDAARADVQAKLNAEQADADKRLAARIEAAEAKVNDARAKALAEVPGIAESLARDIAAKLAPANG